MRFIDLFAGIGGFRLAAEASGMKCVFSSEIDRFARQTYAANFGAVPDNEDIRNLDVREIPDFDLLLAGFPCQGFSLAGVSKNRSLGRPDGFEHDQGNLFFEIMRIVDAKRPRFMLLENVRNLYSHDSGRTWQRIRSEIEQRGYVVRHTKINAYRWVPQTRIRAFIVCFRKPRDEQDFFFPGPPHDGGRTRLADILESGVDESFRKSDHAWRAMLERRERNRLAGKGFGVRLPDLDGPAGTLTKQYYKDGLQVLIDDRPGQPPRMLTPRECARLMGFPDTFKIPVSKTQAYQQFGNSVVVPLATAIVRALVRVVREQEAA